MGGVHVGLEPPKRKNLGNTQTGLMKWNDFDLEGVVLHIGKFKNQKSNMYADTRKGSVSHYRSSQALIALSTVCFRKFTPFFAFSSARKMCRISAIPYLCARAPFPSARSTSNLDIHKKRCNPLTK